MTPPLALTMGEPAGIGGEITLKAWLRREEGIPPFFVIDDANRLEALARRLGWTVPIEAIAAPAECAALFGRVLPVLEEPLAAAVEPGRPNVANAGPVIAAIDRGGDLVLEGSAAALVTNPINKGVLKAAGFRHPGHTEHLGERAGKVPVMMLACPGLRVVPVTIHLALKDAIAALTTEAIIAAGRVTALALASEFGIQAPHLAVAALNPHGGENGAMGTEEMTIIRPAVEQLRSLGIKITGPAPADTLFHEEARRHYDAVLCMYHDQALIPLKTIDFEHGVNVTLGLPFIRTSPDHGTAFDIAGKGVASPASLIAALHLAAGMARRKQWS